MTDTDIFAAALAATLCDDMPDGPDRFMVGDTAAHLEHQHVLPDDMRAIARAVLDNLNNRGLYLVAAQWDPDNDCLT